MKRKSNLSFIRVIRNSSFDQCFLCVYMIKTFLKILWCQFLVPHSEHLLVSSGATLSRLCLCILTFSMLVYYKGASTKSFRHACVFWPLRGWGVGLVESIKKEEFVTKIFFYIILNQVLKSSKK